MDERELAVTAITKLGYPGLAKLVAWKSISGKGVLNGIRELYWKEHTEDERRLIVEMLNHCEYYEI